jgi:hypothetical protein
MHRSRLLVVVMTLGASLLLGGAGASLAHDATPAADTSPENCTQAPRALEDIQAIAGTPAPEGAGEATAAAMNANEQSVDLPTGQPASQDAIDGIMATIEQNIACYNAGDYLAGFGGVTDHFLQSQVGLALFDEDFVATMTASPVALADDQQTTLVGTSDFTLYDDGRVGVLVSYTSPTPQAEGINGLEIDLWIFQEVDGRWLLDESIQDLEQQMEAMGSPVAG